MSDGEVSDGQHPEGLEQVTLQPQAVAVSAGPQGGGEGAEATGEGGVSDGKVQRVDL